ncbi:AhpC/TSA family protein [Bacillus timonensis]|nr:AhpC/TSA family protein [Bacillus timonensis]
MSLQTELKALNEDFSKKTPKFVLKWMNASAEKLAKQGLERNAMKEGDVIPDFGLKNAVGKTIHIRELLKKGPVVLNFYRGGWCPYCNLELKAYQKVIDDIRSLGAELVAISPELPDESMNTIEKYALAFEVLSDEGNVVAKKFGIVFQLDKTLQRLYRLFGVNFKKRHGNKEFMLPFPATYVVDQSGKVRFAYVDADYTKRSEPKEVLKVLQSI